MIADADERLLRERRTEISTDAFDDAASGAAEARISFVPGLRERRGRCLSKNRARATREIAVLVAFAAELEEVIGVVILGEKAEQHSSRVGKGRRVLIPAILEETAHGADRTDALEAFGARRRNRKHRMVPRPIPLLLHRQRQCGAVRKGKNR